MKYNQITKELIETKLYKLCDREVTREIMREYPLTSTWKLADIFRAIVKACLEHTSIKDVYDSPETPSGDTIYKRCNELPWQKTERLVNEWVSNISSRIILPKKAFITVSIDFHQRRYYGDPSPEWVTGMKRKKGTNYAVAFMVATITTKTIRCPLKMLLLTKKRIIEKFAMISTLLGEISLQFPIRRVLLDRGFCQEAIIQVLESWGLEWIIAAVRRSGVKKICQMIKVTVDELAKAAGIEVKDKFALGRWARKQGLDVFRVESVVTRKKGIPVPLVAVYVRHRTHNKNPTKRWTYSLFLYLTNKKCSTRYIVKLYSKRWAIETDFRYIIDFQAVTNSTSPSLRLLLYGLAVYFNALWIVFSVCENTLAEYSSLTLNETSRFLYKFCF